MKTRRKLSEKVSWVFSALVMFWTVFCNKKWNFRENGYILKEEGNEVFAYPLWLVFRKCGWWRDKNKNSISQPPFSLAEKCRVITGKVTAGVMAVRFIWGGFFVSLWNSTAARRANEWFTGYEYTRGTARLFQMILCSFAGMKCHKCHGSLMPYSQTFCHCYDRKTWSITNWGQKNS